MPKPLRANAGRNKAPYADLKPGKSVLIDGNVEAVVLCAKTYADENHIRLICDILPDRNSVVVTRLP